MSRKRKQYDDDDGRVIAKMNVDGMPWYMDKSLIPGTGSRSESSSDFSDLTKAERRELIKGSVKAGMVIAGVFILAAFLFIIFCQFVWFG